MGAIGDLFWRLKTDDKQFKKDLVKSGQVAGDAAGKVAGESMSKRIGASLRKHSTLIATSMGAALGTGLASAGQAFAKFENQMNEVFTLLPDISEDAMKKMEGQVKSFSNEFGVLPEEVVPALYQSLSAGIPEDNVFEFLETANKLAKGGVAETAEAVAVLAAVTKGFGVSGDAANKTASDLLFTTVKLGTTTIPELSASIGKAIPLTASLGASQEELFASMAALTGVTGNTAEVTTQMRATMQALVVNQPAMVKALKGIGFENGQAAQETLGFKGTLDALVASVDGDTTALGKMFGSAEAVTAVLALTGARADAFSSNLDEMGAAAIAGGAVTEKAFQRMESGVTAQANKIKARMATMMISVGESIAPIAPLLMAFGPTIGKALGGMFGAGFGFLITKIPMLMAPVLAAMSSALGASQAIGGLMSSLWTGMKLPMTKMGTLAGGRFGKAFKIGAVLAIAALWAEVFIQFQEFNKKVAKAQDDLQASSDAALGLSGNKAIDALEATTKVMRDMNFIQRGLANTAGNEQILSGLQNLGQAILSETELTAEDIERAGVALQAAAEDAFARGGDAIGNELLRVATTISQQEPFIGEAVTDAVEGGVEKGIGDIDAEGQAIIDEANRVADAFIDPLEEELEGGVGDVILNIPKVIDDALGQLREGATAEEAFSDLGENASAALMAALEEGVDMEVAFANLPTEMRDALRPIIPVIKRTMKLANREAEHEMRLLGPSMKEGIKAGRDAVKGAMADLRWALEHPMAQVKTIAKLEGALTSKAMAKGLKSKNPDVFENAKRIQAGLREEWTALTGVAWDFGKGTTENFAAGTANRAARRKVRRQARRNRNAATEPLGEAPEKALTFGERVAKSFAAGITAFISWVTEAATALAGEVSKPTEPGSPTETGPLSQNGGIEAWGATLAKNFGTGIEGTAFDPVSALGLSAFTPNMSPGPTPNLAGQQAANDGGGMTVNLTTQGLPTRARTPLEVAQQVQRAARLGVISPKRRARFEVNP